MKLLGNNKLLLRNFLEGSNLLIRGPINSGKTEILNELISVIESTSKVAVIEKDNLLRRSRLGLYVCELSSPYVNNISETLISIKKNKGIRILILDGLFEYLYDKNILNLLKETSFRKIQIIITTTHGGKKLDLIDKKAADLQGNLMKLLNIELFDI